jgi:hypothetical protein
MSRSKHIERRKKFTAVELIKFWFKANEKLFWVLFLTAICFSFGFAMGPQQLMNLVGGAAVWGKIGNEEVTLEEWKNAGEELRMIGTRFPSPGLEFSDQGLSRWDYLMFQREADRQGIVVSREELGERVRSIYWSLKVAFESGANPQERLEELRTANLWDEDEYERLLRDERIGIRSPRFFEKALANYMKVEKIKNEVEQAASVSPEEVTAMFDRFEQFRKLSFFEFDLDEERTKAIAEKLTEDELREFYDDNESKFKFYTPELQLDYVFVPTAHYEETLEFTESDISDKYDQIKNPRFQRVLDADIEEPGFALLDEEEEAAVEAELFQPLSEVREEVIAVLKTEKSKSSASQLTRDLAKKMLPRPKGQVGAFGAGSDGGDLSLEDAKAQYPFIEVGTTEWFNSGNARDKLGNVYASNLSTMASTANKNRTLAADVREEYKLVNYGLPTRDQDGYVLYTRVIARYPNETEFEDHQDEAREKLAIDRLIEELEDQTKPLLAQIADGSLDLDKVAEQFGAKVHTTPFLGRSDPINVPVEEDEDEDADSDKTDPDKDDATADADEEDEGPKTERLKGDYIVRGQGFAVPAPGQCKLARDAYNGKLFLVRFDDKRNADSEELTDEKKRSFYDSILVDRRNAVFVKWRKNLWKSTPPLLARYGPPGARDEEAAGADQSAPEANASQ